MSVAAPNSSSLLSRLRSSFSSPVGSLQPQVPPVSLTSSEPAAQPNIPPTAVAPDLSVTDKLDLFDQILTETEQKAQARVQAAAPEPAVSQPAVVVTPLPPEPPAPVVPPTPPIQVPAQAVPLAVDQAINDINQTYVGRSAKEAYPAAPAALAPAESGAGSQVVEVEPNRELPVEVEGFIQEVQDHQEQMPHEIVIADGSLQLNSPALPLKPVVVLPITPEVEEVGAKKGTAFSVRWLVEWSRKLMKMFSGSIIYREA